MALIFEQRFPLGRFHATRWNQNPFEDPYGEWPPSPWRLLRAFAARWSQYAREIGDSNPELLRSILEALSSELPSFLLPAFAWRGLALRQYHPAAVKFTKKKSVPEFKRAVRSLALDTYHAVPPDQPIYWIWSSLELLPAQSRLLNELLRRMLYFGRAEAYCNLSMVDALPPGREPNCILTSERDRGNPVLVPRPGEKLDIKILLAATDDKLISHRRIPPGTAWYYAKLPAPPRVRPKDLPAVHLSLEHRVIQFAVGGRVYPPLERWIKVTERFRGRVIRNRAKQLTGNAEARYGELGTSQRDELALLTGKDGRGRPIEGHRHAFFLLWPDDNGSPSRLVCFRTSPFNYDEIEAVFTASDRPISWEAGSPDWSLGLVPLPFETPPPEGLFGTSSHWVSATPFVPPGNRYRFRRGGRGRTGESPEKLLAKLLVKSGFPDPARIEPSPMPLSTRWLYVHTTLRERRRLRKERTPSVRLGHWFKIQFESPVTGPICVGHSSHFGLGLFVPFPKSDGTS